MPLTVKCIISFQNKRVINETIHYIASFVFEKARMLRTRLKMRMQFIVVGFIDYVSAIHKCALHIIKTTTV